MTTSLSPGSGEALPGVRKAAMLMILVGDKASAEIIKQLTEEEVQLVSREIARLEGISSEHSESLLEEFYQMAMARRFSPVRVAGVLIACVKMFEPALGFRRRETGEHCAGESVRRGDSRNL